MNNFSSVKISDIGTVTTGRTPKTSKANNYGNDYMFIGPTDLHKHFFITESERMVTQQGFDSIKSSTLNGVSVLVGCIGWDMGNVGIVDAACVTNQQINSITNIKDSYNPYYIYYWLKTKKDFLFSQATVTRTPILNKSTFSNIEIYIPSERSSQDGLVEILIAIDKKVELNNQINAELEAMAKTLYDYWFVQFDFPDAEGKPYKSSGGKMVYNEVLKREIPQEWQDSTLWDIAKYYNGLAMQKYRPTGNDYLPVIKIREMNNGISPDTEKARIDIPSAAIIDDGDLLFSWSATLDVKIWSQGKGALNQHIFKVTSEDYPQSFYYFELMNYLNHFKMMAEMRKTTMGHITLDHLKQANIVLPPINLIKKLDEKLKPIFEHSLVLKKENNSLVELRDWLLPMLMNGQVTVK